MDKNTKIQSAVQANLPIDALFYIAYSKEEIPDIGAAREYAAKVLEIIGVDIEKYIKILGIGESENE